ncbi:MAG: hypothetical protein LBU79_04065 [Planctomycetota bacterium]|jgi:hypothetical protein|nr:hypothetical protein [Planctomycetota bacterium]
MTSELITKLKEQIKAKIEPDLKPKVIEKERPKGIEQGRAQGKAEIIIKVLIHNFNSVPAYIQRKIQRSKDPASLDSLLNAALTSQSIAEFKLKL